MSCQVVVWIWQWHTFVIYFYYHRLGCKNATLIYYKPPWEYVDRRELILNSFEGLEKQNFPENEIQFDSDAL